MSPESPTPREQLEARLTALLLGELSEDEAAALREIIARDAQLAALHARMKETIDLVREAAADPAELAEEKPAPVRLGEERRQKMLEQFKTVTPAPFAPKRAQWNPWSFVLQAAAVVALLACLSGLLLPALSKSKAKSQSVSVLGNLRQIEIAKQIWADDNKKGPRDTPTLQELAPYLGRGSDGNLPKTSLGESYIIGPVGESPRAELDAIKAKKFGGRQVVMLPSKDAGKQEIALADNIRQLAESQAFRRNESLAAPQPNSAEPVAAAPVPMPPPTPGSGQPQATGPTATGNITPPPATGNIVLPQPAPVEMAANDTGKVTDGQIRDNYGLVSSQDGDVRQRLMDRRAKENKDQVQEKEPSTIGLQLSRPPEAGSNGGAEAKKTDTEMAWSTDSDKATTGNWGLADGSVQKGSTGAFHTYVEKPAAASPQQTMAFGNNLGLSTTQLVTDTIASNEARQAATARPTQSAADYAIQDRSVELLAAKAAPTPSPSAGGQIVTFQNSAGDGSTVHLANGVGGGFGGAGGGGVRSPVSGKPSTLARMSAAPKQNGAGEQQAETLAETTPMTPALLAPTASAALPGASSVDNSGSLVATDESVRRQAEPFAPKNANPQDVTQAFKNQTGQYPLMSRSKTVQQNVPGATAPGDLLTQGTVTTESGRSATNVVAQLDSSAGKPSNLVGVGMIVGTNVPVMGDEPLPKLAVSPAPVPQPEVLVSDNAFSTFSLNVSDVSFKLAAASLERGVMPDVASIRSEEFINAFDYRDPDPAPGAPIGFASERAHDPFAQNRDFLRFSVKTAAAGRQPGRPLNLVLLLDNSGSMERADRVAIIHEALRVLAAQLQSQDTISVVTFARTPRLWVDGIPGTQAGQVLETVSGLTPEGGTDLGDALDLAYATAHRHYLANGVNRVVLLTDGAANLGNVDPTALKASVEAQRKQGIDLDCFGIGWEGYNDDLLEVLTRNGDGRYGFINTPEEAASGFAAQLAGALHVAASDVKVQVEFNPARVVSYRQIGYAKHQLTKEQFRDNSVNAAQIGAAEAGNGLYTVEINPQGTGPVCTVHVRYRDPGTANYYEHAWDVPYTGAAVALDQASPAMRLAATASAFSEWLASSPYAGEVSPDALLKYLQGVPAVYGADTRPAQLETMIREAKSVSGK